jgi:predicted DNA-binding transcriptional regulator YafY
MPANKYALLRYRIIDRCLSNSARPYPTKEDLREACEDALYGDGGGDRISLSTIEKDLYAMRFEAELGFHAPIAFCRLNRGYHYTDPDYTIAELHLNDDELDAIRFAARTLVQFRDVPIFSQFGAAISKIADRLSIAPNLDTAGLEDLVAFESAPAPHGPEWLAPLLEAIRERRTVELAYRKFDGSPAATHVLDPHLLKEYRNRWYVVGWEAARRDFRTFGLDRIASVVPTGAGFTRRPDFDGRTYFASSFGITTLASPPLDVVLRCTPVEARYLSSLPAHPSQRLHEREPSVWEARFSVTPSFEFLQFILGLGPAVVVESPPELRDRIAEALQAALAQYR